MNPFLFLALRQKKKVPVCVSGYMEFQNRTVGRIFFFFFQNFYMGIIGKLQLNLSIKTTRN